MRPLYINQILLNWIITAESDIDFAVGGQAVMEGVMMRSPNSLVISVRKQAGNIKSKKRKYRTLTQRFRLLNIPILRGIINLFEMMYIGTSAINFSANEMLEDETGQPEGEKTKWQKVIEALMMVFSFILAIGLSIVLFKVIPLSIATLLERYFPSISENYILFNAIDGASKMLIFLSYIYILTLFKSFYRIFEYHGAEHKSINTYENHQKLVPENAAKESRFHPRCGTSFVLIVFVTSILVYTVVPRQPDFLSNLGMRIALLPLIAGISYEYLKLSARFVDNIVVRAIITPGLWFQRLTTKEPDEGQLEVGLKSLKDSLAMEASEV
ncbi:DUF1385 domain-containing protein [Patescibacteria group bacterium]|nr:DUF1385 domain-containing protein [Patescibacteria group bacterium]